MDECRVEFAGDRNVSVVQNGEVIATSAGEDRDSAVINLWAMLLAEDREDLAAVVAREHAQAATRCQQ